MSSKPLKKSLSQRYQYSLRVCLRYMNYPMKYKLAIFFTFLVFTTTAQKVFQFDSSINVRAQERDLLMPFAGGINSAQLQQIDLDEDGQEELVVWDKNAANLLVFEKIQGHFIHKPELAYHFPEDIS